MAPTATPDSDRALRPTIWPALVVGLLALGAALGTGSVLRSREVRTLDMATASALLAVSNEIEHGMGDQIRALERLAADWRRRGGLSRGEFEAAAAELAQDFVHIQAIEWAAPDFHVSWIVPLPGNEAALGLDLAFEDRRRTALEAARDSRAVATSRPVRLVQGGRGFLVYVPLHVDDRFDGFVVGVYRGDELLSAMLRNLAPGFEIRASDGDELFFAREEPDTPWPPGPSQRMQLSGLRWSIDVAPGPDVVSTYRTYMPSVVVLGGGLLALGFASATQLARSRRVRNRRLAAEVRRRRAAEGELSMVLHALPDHVWSAEVTPEGIEPGFFSPVIERITGHPAETFMRDPNRWLEIVHEADRERVRRVHRELLKEEREAFAIEYRIVARDGDVRWVRERVCSTPTERGRRFDGVTSDITEIKRAEEERLELEATLQHGQKLESLGVLAGGIAHDFNNLMVGVLGHTQLAMDALPEDTPARAPLERARRAAHRATDLCRQMLAYAGQVSIEKRPISLRDAVEEVGELLAASISKKVELCFEFEAGLPPIEADATQIRQVVLNLVTNAAEAIGDRTGTVRVRAELRTLSRAELGCYELGRELEAGRYVALTVADDGCGMEAGIQERFMEPFFTTKFSGRGLGLAAVQGIVRRHGGAIGVASAVGRGTTITLLLPALEGVATRVVRVRPEPRPGVCDGTVLVVDDDADAREVASRVLGRAGYRVLEAGDGVEAVEVLRKHAGEVGCVLLDLTMPRLDGADALEALREVRPDVPVILCSGYAEATAMARFESLDLASFLPKPYDFDELISQVAAAHREAPGAVPEPPAD